MSSKKNIRSNPVISLAISSCLAGNSVRYDGSHKRSKFCLDVLGDWFDYYPICPEVGIGMSTPRPPIHLVRKGESIRVMNVADHTLDVTDELTRYAEQRVNDLDDVCGYVVIRNSPSCGMERVRVYHDNKNPSNESSRGAFIGRIMALRPDLPVEEEGRLQDPQLRENFITRVFAFNDFKQTVESVMTISALVEFHSRYKYQIMAHSYLAYKELGRLVANHDSTHEAALINTYKFTFMASLKKVATRKSHTNVLYHIAGYLKQSLTPQTKQQLVEVIEQYRKNMVTLIAPITLINHYLQQYGTDYIKKQSYLNPHPIELGLRNYL